MTGQTKPNSALRMTTSVELNVHYSLMDCEPFCSGLPDITTLKLFICMIYILISSEMPVFILYC